MADLSVFIPSRENTAAWENIGHGRCLFLHYIEKPGIFKRGKTKKHMEKAKGTVTLQPFFAEKYALPLLKGDEERLIHALWPALLPKGAEEEGLTLSVGEMFDIGAILEVAARVRSLRIVSAAGEGLCDLIEEETGLCVPLLRTAPKDGGFSVRLPGGMELGEEALDLAKKGRVKFSPPRALQKVCRRVGSDGETLEALLRFFAIPYKEAGVFLSKSTKVGKK